MNAKSAETAEIDFPFAAFAAFAFSKRSALSNRRHGCTDGIVATLVYGFDPAFFHAS